MTRVSLRWLPALLLLAGCFSGAEVSKIFCATNDNCPSGYVCADSSKPGGCVRKSDAGSDLVSSSDGTGFLLPDGAKAADSTGSLGDLLGYDGDVTGSVDLSEQSDIPIAADVVAVDVTVLDAPFVDGTVPDAPFVDVTVHDAPFVDGAPSDGLVVSRPDVPGDLLPVDAALKPMGESCQNGNQCASAYCVDSVCCDGTCTGQCQSCSLQGKVGTCSAVTGAPPTNKTSCTGSGTCGGSCNGKSAVCAYPGIETSCGSASCSSGTATSARACSGSGSCSTATTTLCGNYVCGSTACLATCSSIADCVAGAVCSGGSCVACAQTVCGGACVNTDSDPLNCGRCSHVCGGSAACSNGRCQPVPMVSSLPASAGYDVGPDGLFYTSNGTVYGCTQTSCSGTNQRQVGGGFVSTSDLVLTRGVTPNQVVFYGSQSQPNYGLYACPVTTGCPSSPTPIVGYGPQTQWSLRSFQANSGDVYYLNAGMVTAIYHCSGTSSSCTITAGGGPGTAHVPSADGSLDVARAFATDATYVYFFESIDSNNDFSLDRCPNNASCATPDILVPSIFTPTILVAYNGKLYWSLSKSGDPISQCDLPACSTQTSFLTSTAGAVLGLAADSSGVYWMTTSGVYTCPLAGCPGVGPTVLTSSVADGSKELRVQDSSVYWLTPGAGTDGVIYRVAKP